MKNKASSIFCKYFMDKGKKAFKNELKPETLSIEVVQIKGCSVYLKFHLENDKGTLTTLDSDVWIKEGDTAHISNIDKLFEVRLDA